MAEHIVAVFDSEPNATAAARSLENAGIPASAIRQYADVGTRPGEVGHSETTTTHTSGGGFWALLFGDEPDSTGASYANDRDQYERRAQAGNVIVSVIVEDDSKIHQAIETIEAHNPLDIDEHTDEHGYSGHHMPSDVGHVTPTISTASQDLSGTKGFPAGLRDTPIPDGRIGNSTYST